MLVLEQCGGCGNRSFGLQRNKIDIHDIEIATKRMISCHGKTNATPLTSGYRQRFDGAVANAVRRISMKDGSWNAVFNSGTVPKLGWTFSRTSDPVDLGIIDQQGSTA